MKLSHAKPLKENLMIHLHNIVTATAITFGLLLGTASLAETQRFDATGEVEIAFSPRGSAQELAIKVIDSANSELLVMAYSFTSSPITAAMLRAKKRGVSVYLIADEKNNLAVRGGSAKAKAALSALSTAGVNVRTTSVFPIHHDKVIIADVKHVQAGSFNYSDAAQKVNSETMLVLWNNPKVAEAIRQHFDRNYKTGRTFTPDY